MHAAQSDDSAHRPPHEATPPRQPSVRSDLRGQCSRMGAWETGPLRPVGGRSPIWRCRAQLTVLDSAKVLLSLDGDSLVAPCCHPRIRGGNVSVGARLSIPHRWQVELLGRQVCSHQKQHLVTLSMGEFEGRSSRRRSIASAPHFVGESGVHDRTPAGPPHTHPDAGRDHGATPGT